MSNGQEWNMEGWDYIITQEDADALIRWRRHIVDTCIKAANAGDYAEADMWYEKGGLCPEDFEEFMPYLEGLG